MELRLSKDLECKTLAELKVGQRAKVVELLVESLTRRRFLDLGLLPGTEVRDVMSSPLITIEPAATIKEAAQTMISKKGRLAVFTAGKLVGVITASALTKSLPESLETSLKVDNVMTKGVIMVPSSTTVEEVAKIMGEKRIGSVIITRRGKPFGIFTERDLLTTFLTRGKPLKTKVGVAASSPLITIPLGTSVHQATLTMTLKHIKRLPIFKDDAIVGIVTARDLVEAYAK